MFSNGIIIFDERKAKHIIGKIRFPLLLFSHLFSWIPEYVFYKIFVIVGRRILIKPSDYRRLDDDIGFLISQQRIGILFLDKGNLKFIHGDDPFKLYHQIESSLPFGKLSDIGNFGLGTTILSKVNLIKKCCSMVGWHGK